MTLRWRLTISTLIFIAVSLVLLNVHDYLSLRAFLLDSVAVRMRAQAKPIIDAELLDQPVDEATLRMLAPQLATDLTSKDTGALIVDRHGQVIGRHISEIGEPTPPELPVAWYAPALAGELEPNYIIENAGGTQTMIALVPIPPRQEPFGVVVLATSLEATNQLIREHVLSFLLASLAVLGLAAVLIFVMVRAQLRPLERMVAVADQIARGDLSQRVRLPHGRDEVGQLARSFDEMIDHIQAAFEAQAQSEARLRQFLADVSHELRTPLTVIGGYTDLLLSGVATAPEKRTAVAQTMRREVDRTSRLVRDLLLLVRSDRAATFNMQLVDLSGLCAEVAEEVRLMAADHRLWTHIETGVIVYGDSDRLAQVLLNLLDNALKHTTTGTQIELQLTTQDGQAVVTINDTGSGIPPDIFPYIFERFYHGRDGHSHGRSSGLGLAIAKAIVEAHGGSISAANRPGGGACFEVRLPLGHRKRSDDGQTLSKG